MDYQDALDRAGAEVRNKIGQVLSSQSVIMGVRDRASNYRATENTTVNGQAEAVTSKANGLLQNYSAIEADSITLLGKASAMQAKMQVDPLWIAIQNGDYEKTLGWAALSRAKDYIGEAVALTQQLAGLSKRADNHLSAVDDLQSDESSLESFAAGKGVKAALNSALSFGTGYVSMVKYAAIGVGLFFVWDLAKPFVVARKAYANPRRRNVRR